MTRSVLMRLKPRDTNTPVPLTGLQRSFLNSYLDHGTPRSRRMTIGAVRILGRLDADRLLNCIDTVTDRHDVLRTRIIIRSGVPVQCVGNRPENLLQVGAFEASSRLDTENRMRHLTSEFFDRTIDVTTDPVFAGVLLRVSDQEHLFLLGLDHIAGDVQSGHILSRELWNLYDTKSSGRDLQRPLPLIQFPDYAAWWQQMASHKAQIHEAHWRARTSSILLVAAPSGDNVADPAADGGSVQHVAFGRKLTLRLHELATSENTFLPIVVLCAYCLAVSHWCDRERFVVPFVTHGRYGHPELRTMIGCFASVVPFLIEINRSHTISQYLSVAHEEFMSLISHHDCAPDWPSTDRGDFLFNWGGTATYESRWFTPIRDDFELRIQPFPARRTAPAGLVTFFSATPSGIVATVNYPTRAIKQGLVERFAGDVRYFASALAGSRSARLSSLPYRNPVVQ